MTTGVLPAPTPIAGLPELYAAFTMPGPPVARDQVDVRVMHQRVRQFYRRLIDPANQVLRRAGRDGSLQHDISRFVGGFFCTRVRRENDGVTRFQTDERFENGC